MASGIEQNALIEFAKSINSDEQSINDTKLARVSQIGQDGTVYVSFPGGSEDTPIATTGVELSAGDLVNVILSNGKLRISGNVTQPAINKAVLDKATSPIMRDVAIAKKAADEAEAVATAVNQHFWNDTNGAHVTDITHDAWEDAAADGFSDLSDLKPYPNLLLNSLGILLRSALNNLVSITRSAIAFYDGLGNTASNIVAQFGVDGARLGYVDQTHAVVDGSGLQVYDDDGNATASFLADGSQIGALESTRLSLSGDGIVGYTSDGKPVMTVDMDVGTVTEQVQPEMSTRGQFARIQKNSTKVTAVSKSLVDISSGSSAVWVGGNQSVELDFKGTWGIGTPTVSTGITATVTFNQVVTLTLTSDASQTVGTANTKSYTASFTVSQYVGGVGTVDYPITVTISRKMLTSTNRAQLELSVKNGSTAYVYDNPIAYSIYGYFPRITIDAIAPAFMFGDDYDSPGMYSAAIGRGLQAASDYQAVLGKYNVADSSDAYALIVGNGTAATRSNAFTVAWDGSINSKTFTTTTISDTISAASGVTINDCSFAQWGKLAMLNVSCKKSTAIAANTATVMFTMVSGKRPPFECAGVMPTGNGDCYITSDGNVIIRVNSQYAANTNIYIRITYLLA